MADFPNNIYTPRETENLAGVVYNPDQKTNFFAEDFNGLANEIVAIERALGIPSVSNQDVFPPATLISYYSIQTYLTGIYIDSHENVVDINCPFLRSYTNQILINNCNNLTSLTLPYLNTAYDLEISSNPLLSVLDFSSWQTAHDFVIANNDNFSYLSITGMIHCNKIEIRNNIILGEISLSSSIDCLNYILRNNAFTQVVVDAILLAIDTAGFSGGTLDLSGGTNAVPTDGVLNVYYLSLRAKGWTVTINT